MKKNLTILSFTAAILIGLVVSNSEARRFRNNNCADGKCNVVQKADDLELSIRRPKVLFTADKTEVKKDEIAKLSWNISNSTEQTLNDEKIEAVGSKEISITETTTYTIKASNRRKSTSEQITIQFVGEVIPPTPPEPPTPPVPGFSLGVIGIGSQFNIDDTLSKASRDHEVGTYITSQNGNWTLITDEAIQATHSPILDLWIKEFEKSGKQKPGLILHNQGKTLGVVGSDEVAGKSSNDILTLLKKYVPSSDQAVVVRGKVYPLGLKPANTGKKFAGPKISSILKPLEAKDCPSVDLSSQVLYLKNQTAGTCVLNSFAGACESAVYVAYGKENCIEFSPYFLAKLTNGYNGTWGSEAADAVQKYGNLPFGDMKPYDNFPAGYQTKAANYKCLAVYGPPDNNPEGYIRAALNRGYIVCGGIGVGSGFDTDSEGYISYNRGGTSSINHEIRIIGWDQAKKRYLIMNSWGQWGWKNSGKAWLEDRFFKYDTDLWVVVAMTASPTYQFYKPIEDVK